MIGLRKVVNLRIYDIPETTVVHKDRKSVVQGKSVDLGGRRIIKKKTNNKKTRPE